MKMETKFSVDDNAKFSKFANSIKHISNTVLYLTSLTDRLTMCVLDMGQ